MKAVVIIFCLFFFNSNCFAQKEKQCDAVLLATGFMTNVSCGRCMIVDKIQFQLEQPGKKDTVTLYVVCPAEHGRKFWVINSKYHIIYHEGVSPGEAGNKVLELSDEDKKNKVVGTLVDVKKY